MSIKQVVKMHHYIMYIIIDSKEHVNKMISSQTMTKEELYNMGACDYDSVYMSEVRTGLPDISLHV